MKDLVLARLFWPEQWRRPLQILHHHNMYIVWKKKFCNDTVTLLLISDRFFLKSKFSCWLFYSKTKQLFISFYFQGSLLMHETHFDFVCCPSWIFLGFFPLTFAVTFLWFSLQFFRLIMLLMACFILTCHKVIKSY